MKHARGGAPLQTLLDGRYRIERELGAGGSGVVYAAVHVGLDSQVAVKLLQLPPQLTAEQQSARVADFLEEARTLTRLKHPSIVTAVDLGVVQLDGAQHPYFVMELCAGRSLRDFLEEEGGLGLSQAWELFEPLVRATAHAHRLGVVHRDIKPGNVMLDTHPEDGRLTPKLIDFGVSKAMQGEVEPGTGSTQTTSGSSPHTPAYAAPEQVAGGRTGPWTDVHALGLLFVELLTGEPPYGYDDPRMRVIDATRPSPAAHGVEVGDFEQVIRKALALRPQDRFRDAGELLAALVECARGAGLAVMVGAPAALSAAAFDRTVDVPQRAVLRGPDSAPAALRDFSGAETVVAASTEFSAVQTAEAGIGQVEVDAPLDTGDMALAASEGDQGRPAPRAWIAGGLVLVGCVGVGIWMASTGSRISAETADLTPAASGQPVASSLVSALASSQVAAPPPRPSSVSVAASSEPSASTRPLARRAPAGKPVAQPPSAEPKPAASSTAKRPTLY